MYHPGYALLMIVCVLFLLVLILYSIDQLYNKKSNKIAFKKCCKRIVNILLEDDFHENIILTIEIGRFFYKKRILLELTDNKVYLYPISETYVRIIGAKKFEGYFCIHKFANILSQYCSDIQLIVLYVDEEPIVYNKDYFKEFGRLCAVRNIICALDKTKSTI